MASQEKRQNLQHAAIAYADAVRLAGMKGTGVDWEHVSERLADLYNAALEYSKPVA